MAISKLPTNFVDDIIDTSVNEHRKYKMTAVSGETDTYELEDKTTYTQQGTPYNATVVNNTNGTINQVIDLAEDNADTLSDILDGTTAVAKAGTANTATTATTANSANTATSAGTATSATSADTATTAGSATTATNATSATTATTADKLTNSRTINGVAFDGSQSITVYDNTKVSNDSDFILLNQQTLAFVGNVCTLSDNRITASSLADVYFTSATQAIAESADIIVDTTAGAVKLTASNTPTGNIVATIHIRVA